MTEFLKWLSANPVAITAVTGSFAILVLIYIVAFLQGREISFWPPKIGAKPGKLKSEKSTKNIEDASRNLSETLKHQRNISPNMTLPEVETLPKLKTTRRKSMYSTDCGTEAKRLLVQGEKTKGLDKRAFDYALGLMNDSKGLLALDVGCSTGKITSERFSTYDAFGHVIGVDYNERDILQANTANYGERFTFLTLDIESEHFEEEVKSILELYHKEEFDFIF